MNRPDEETLLAHSRILESMAEGVNVSDRDGIIFFTNPAFDRMFGYEPDELSGKHVSVLNAVPDAENAAMIESIIGDLEQYGEWSGEFRNRRKDGSVFTTWARVTQMTIAGELYWVSVQEDTTHKNELEAQVRHAQKMEALGRLAGGVAHDFNNVLVAVLANADSLCRDLALEDPRRQTAEEIVQAARRAAALTKQLLTFSRRAPPRPEVVDVVAAIQQVGGMLRRLIGDEFPLIIELPAEPRNVLIDRAQLEQVLMNLVLNARDASRPGQPITLRLRDGDRDVVVMEVQDEGTGLSPDIRERVFDPFFTTKEPGKGTGLGLATALGIVQSVDGRIEIDSEQGQGTVVRVQLPRSSQAAPLSVSPPQPKDRAVRNCTVLLVEDDSAVRRATGAILRDAGYQVLEATDGVDGLELARRVDGEVDLLLSDVRMPRMSGPELAEQLKRERPGTQFLFMSGYPGMDSSTNEVLGTSGAALVPKPFTARELLQAIDRALTSTGTA